MSFEEEGGWARRGAGMRCGGFGLTPAGGSELEPNFRMEATDDLSETPRSGGTGFKTKEGSSWTAGIFESKLLGFMCHTHMNHVT